MRKKTLFKPFITPIDIFLHENGVVKNYNQLPKF